jgi:diaminopimelate decarboxylase
MPRTERGMCEHVGPCVRQHKTELRTPMYLYCERCITRSIGEYKSLFPEDSRLFYSVKANPQVWLLQHCVSQGVGMEVVSRGEWDLARSVTSEPGRVLVGGISKSKAFLQRVREQPPAAVIIESETEYRRLRESWPARNEIPLLLRVNPGVKMPGISMAGGTQFGLSIEQARRMATEISRARATGRLGLHFYFGTQRLRVSQVMETLGVIEDAIAAVQSAGRRLEIVALGLGLGVPYLEDDVELDTNVLREQLQGYWSKRLWRSFELWTEAGRALVARVGAFVAEVIDRKTLNGKTYIVLNGGLNVHNPGIGVGRLFSGHPRLSFVAERDGEGEETVDIVGNLCTSSDFYAHGVTVPPLSEGDVVIVQNAGAYTLTTGLWGFNSQGIANEAAITNEGDLHFLRPQIFQMERTGWDSRQE